MTKNILLRPSPFYRNPNERGVFTPLLYKEPQRLPKLRNSYYLYKAPTPQPKASIKMVQISSPSPVTLNELFWEMTKVFVITSANILLCYYAGEALDYHVLSYEEALESLRKTII